MANEVMVTVRGRLGAEVKWKRAVDGGHVIGASFSVATNARYYDSRTQGWKDSETQWFRVWVNRAGLAANVIESLGRGDPVIVVGRLQTWTRDLAEGRTSEPQIVADAVGPDLNLGIAKIHRVQVGEQGPDVPADAEDLATVRPLHASRGEASSYAEEAVASDAFSSQTVAAGAEDDPPF